MRVLLTNNSLADRAGSELYVLDVARRLRALGHEPVAYSTRLGEVAEALRTAGVPVTDNLSRLPFHPDIIHGQHHLETMTALLSLPGVPAISVCHGALPWEEMPPEFPRIMRYVAVDEACRTRVHQEAGVPLETIKLLFNFVDLQRFWQRSPLPLKPQRALVFSNYAKEGNYLKVVRQACAQLGITVDACGSGVGSATSAPERLLPQYDLVFAKARAALEAMAVGNAVILCDRRGCGPLVTTTEFPELRPWNFGFRTLLNEITIENLRAQIARYDANEAEAVCRLARSEAGLEHVVDELVQLYKTVVIEHRGQAPDAAAEAQAAAHYLKMLQARFRRTPKYWLRLMLNRGHERKVEAMRSQVKRFLATAI